MNTTRPGYIPQSGSVVCQKWRWIVGPIFFTTTIISDVYPDILMQFIALLKEDERDCIFQQDGARLHTSKESMAMLRGFFNDRLVSTVFGPPAVQICPPWTTSYGDTWKITFLKRPYQMRTYSVKELRKKFNESRLTHSVWYSKIFDGRHSCV